MLLSKTKNHHAGFKGLLILAVALLFCFVISAPVFAASSPPAAEKACSQKHDGKYTGADEKACEAGYNGGHAQKSSSAVCQYNGSNQDACLDGFGRGACAINNPNGNDLEKCLNANPIIKNIRLIVNFLSAGVGVVITGSIIIGGIQYAVAGNNPNAVSAAKKRIQDTLIALVAFFFIYALLNFLIPGGLLFI
jgi:hypothetical protein